MISTYPNTTKQHIVMGSILYIVAVVLVIAWLIGFLGYSAGGLIHILLVLAVISILVGIIRGRSV
jgi:tryptophan-rich sensory protein